MKKMKELYSSPTTDFLVVRFEENLLTGSDPTASMEIGGMQKGGNGIYQYDALD